MKLAKRILAAVITVMILATCFTCFVNAEATFGLRMTGEKQMIAENIGYTDCEIDSGVQERTEVGTVLEFDPKDGYAPMVFSGRAGFAATLAEHYRIATEEFGYEVAGVINGAFFSMDSGKNPHGNYGWLNGFIVSNGEVASAHAGIGESVVAFDADGTMHIVNSSPEYKLFIKGEEIRNAIYAINKTGGFLNNDNGTPTTEATGTSNWQNNFYYFDKYCGDSALTFKNCKGYEVVCKKVENTGLIIGGTLKGEVVEVRADSYSTDAEWKRGNPTNTAKMTAKHELADDEFVLFVRSDSPKAAYVKDLVAGDSVNITCDESIEGSRSVTENANSIISNVGWLVKDGVDQTLIYDTIGSHGTTTTWARWTAFGTRPDGSYVFFTSQGGSTGDSSRSITLRDVASAMIEMGCNNVIRMDGGGSTAMYVSNLDETGKPGFALVTDNRNVADCILVVKQSGARDAGLENALREAVADAKVKIAEKPNAAVQAVIEEAEALLAGEPMSGEVRRVLQKLASALSGKEDLQKLIASVSGINFRDYSELALEALRTAYDEAVAVLGNEGATLEQINSVYDELKTWYEMTGDAEKIYTKNKAYTTTAPNRGDTYDDDGVRLTDGAKGSPDGGTAKYAGWTADYVEVTVDLGESLETNLYRVYSACGNWGINMSKGIRAFVSEDGENFTDLGEVTAGVLQSGDENVTGAWRTYTFTLETEKINKGRYVKFHIYCPSFGPKFVWIDEVEAGVSDDVIENGISVTNFDAKIGDGDVTVFTPDMGEITVDKANHAWTNNILVRWDEEKQAYVVVKRTQGIGPNTAAVTLGEGEYLIAIHHSVKNTEDSEANFAAGQKIKVGQILEQHGMDIATKKIGVGAYIKFVDPFTALEPATDSGYTAEEGFVTGIKEGTKLSELRTKFNVSDFTVVDAKGNTVADTAVIATGMKLVNGEEEFLLVVKGDVDGNGRIDAVDYLYAKRAYLGTFDLSAAGKKAAAMNDGSAIALEDLIRLKRHSIGTEYIK